MRKIKKQIFFASPKNLKRSLIYKLCLQSFIEYQQTIREHPQYFWKLMYCFILIQLRSEQFTDRVPFLFFKDIKHTIIKTKASNEIAFSLVTWKDPSCKFQIAICFIIIKTVVQVSLKMLVWKNIVIIVGLKSRIIESWG